MILFPIMIPNHLKYQFLCSWFSESSIIWFHYAYSFPNITEIIPSNYQIRIQNNIHLFSKCLCEPTMCLGVFITEIYTVLEPKNQVVTFSFSKMLCEFLLPSTLLLFLSRYLHMIFCWIQPILIQIKRT